MGVERVLLHKVDDEVGVPHRWPQVALNVCDDPGGIDLPPPSTEVESRGHRLALDVGQQPQVLSAGLDPLKHPKHRRRCTPQEKLRGSAGDHFSERSQCSELQLFS